MGYLPLAAFAPAGNHAARGHARLSPSDAKRWTTCTAAIRFCQLHDLKRAGSSFSDEGTEAHEWSERVLKGDIAMADVPAKFAPIATYLDECERLRSTATNHWIELKVALFYAPDEPGTCDFITYDVNTNVLRVLDLKYGAGLFIDAEDNDQLFIYGWSALKTLRESEFSSLPDGPIEMHFGIAQPRNGGHDGQFVRWWTPDWEDMLAREARLLAAVEENTTGLGKFAPSSDACMWCPANPRRQSGAQEVVICGGMQAAVQAVDIVIDDDVEVIAPEKLTLQNCVNLFKHKKAIEQLIEAAERRLREEAVSGSEDSVAVFVDGRKPNRAFTPEGKDKLVELLGDEAYKPRALIGVTDAESKLTKNVVKDLTTSPVPGPKLILRQDLKPDQKIRDSICALSDGLDDLNDEE